jgi:hypothetical protein
VVMTLQTDPGAMVIGGPSIPAVALTCSTCGYVALFNLLVLGLADLVQTEPRP